MPGPSNPPAFDPTTYLQTAFTALCWVGVTFEAAMHDPVRRDIITFIATEWPKRPMENIVSISRIEQLAHHAAARYANARAANPYTEHSAAGGLFVKCFNAEQKRLHAFATRAHEAIETVAAGD